MQLLDVFLSRLLPQVQGCPDPLALQVLLDSAIEFCEKTSIVQVTSAPQTATVNVASYTITVPAQQAVAVTLKAWFGSTPLAPAPADAVSSILAYVASAGTDTVQTGTPRVFYELSPGVIGVYPVPDATTALAISARVATKPTRTATQVDDVLFNDWAEAIVAGAALRLHRTAGSPFYSQSAGDLALAKFWGFVSKATGTALRGRVRASLSVLGRPFA